MNKFKQILLMGSTAGIMASINSYISLRTPELQSVLEGEENYYKWKHGDIFYQVKGEGKKILLLHGLYTGASSYEWRKNFSSLSEHFRVYAPDLMGFGRSVKPRKGYRANNYVKLIFEFIEEVIKDECYIVAGSMSSAYAVRNASLNPRLIKGLILISPILWVRRKSNDILDLITYEFLSSPIIGTTIYNTIASKAFIRHNLETRDYNNSEIVTRDMVNYYHTASHQHGANYFIPAFLTGLLDLDVTEELKTIEQELIICYGKKMEPYHIKMLENLKNYKNNLKYKIFPQTSNLPHNEASDDFNKFIRKTLNNTQ